MPQQTNDTTAVQGGGTGDAMQTDAFTRDLDGATVKTVVVRPAFGPPHQPPTLVSETAPMPVHDKVVWYLLKQILGTLQEILAELRGRR